MVMGIEGVVVEDLRVDVSREVLVAVVRARGNARGRCPECGARWPKYGRGKGPRRWRALKLGSWTT
jgi:transposase